MELKSSAGKVTPSREDYLKTMLDISGGLIYDRGEQNCQRSRVYPRQRQQHDGRA
jgi:hypothetical protein